MFYSHFLSHLLIAETFKTAKKVRLLKFKLVTNSIPPTYVTKILTKNKLRKNKIPGDFL